MKKTVLIALLMVHAFAAWAFDSVFFDRGRPSSDIVLLVHFNGTNQAADFSRKPKTVVINPNINLVIDGTNPKFGGYAAYFGDSGGRLPDLYYETDTDFYFDSGDFTLDFWIYPITISDSYICGFYNAINLAFISGKLFTVVGGYQYGATTITTGTWHHVALTRESGVCKLWLDGTKDAEFTDVQGYSPTWAFGIGTDGLNGGAGQFYIDELRLVRGRCYYTGNSYTVPNREYK